MARCAIVETGYIPSHQRNATPNEVVRTETGCIPSLPPGTDLLAAGGHKTRPYDFGGILGVTTNITGRNFCSHCGQIAEQKGKRIGGDP